MLAAAKVTHVWLVRRDRQSRKNFILIAQTGNMCTGTVRNIKITVFPHAKRWKR